jgi:hypothetical protein
VLWEIGFTNLKLLLASIPAYDLGDKTPNERVAEGIDELGLEKFI